MRSISLIMISVCLWGVASWSVGDDFSAGSPKIESVTLTHAAMGTEFQFVLYPRPGDDSTDDVTQIGLEAFALVDDVERRISSWVADSETAYVNANAAFRPVRVPADFFKLIKLAQKYYQESGGTFDCTVGPLAELYGLYENKAATPDEAELTAAMKRVGMDKVFVDVADWTVSFAEPGMRLDFGGIGKGFVLDQVVEMLKNRGIKRALLHGGTSTVYALGAPPNRDGWTVHVRHPYNSAERVATVVLRDESLSTSGCYGELLERGGESICNIFDPRTGRPSIGAISATAIGPTATGTDALSTAFLVMGAKETRAFQEVHSEMRAIIVAGMVDDEIEIYKIGFDEEE